MLAGPRSAATLSVRRAWTGVGAFDRPPAMSAPRGVRGDFPPRRSRWTRAERRSTRWYEIGKTTKSHRQA
jgi:hypothetical protein